MAATSTAASPDPVDALLAHNRWATGIIIDVCRGLPEEAFARAFPIGPAEHGGLRATLSHIVGAMRRWVDRIADRPLRPALEHWRPGHVPPATPLSPDDLLALLDGAHAELAAVIAEARRTGWDRRRRIEYMTADGPKSFSFSAGVGVASVLAHGHYHRAQCVNILRQLGVRTPAMDVIDWAEAEGIAG